MSWFDFYASAQSSYLVHGESVAVEEDAGEHVHVVATGDKGQCPDNAQRPHSIRMLTARVRHPVESGEDDAYLETKACHSRMSHPLVPIHQIIYSLGLR